MAGINQQYLQVTADEEIEIEIPLIFTKGIFKDFSNLTFFKKSAKLSLIFFFFNVENHLEKTHVEHEF